MFKKQFRYMGAALVGIFSLLLGIAGLGDRLYPDTISCYAWQEVADVAAFHVQQPQELAWAGGIARARGQVQFLHAVPVKNVAIRYYQKNTLIPGGVPFGIKLQTRGLLVTQTGAFSTGGVSVDPAARAGVLPGDRILSIDGVAVDQSAQLVRLVEKSQGRALKLVIQRGEESRTVALTPCRADEDSKFRAGLWVKESTAGIGTLTYVDPVDAGFGGLGHGVTDPSGTVTPIVSGQVWQVRIDGVTKGKAGDPGQLQGSFQGSAAGTVRANTANGVFGTLTQPPQDLGEPVQIALRDEIAPGKATLLTTVQDGPPVAYQVEIERILDADGENKNFMVHVTDPRLLAITGGIVQGMSGSPLLQNGKLVGAVTHVLVNDPTRGYGIYIENMLNAAQSVAESNKIKDAS